MARIRIEWVPIEVYGLGMLGFDHLQLVFQPSNATVDQQDDWYVIEGTRDAAPGLPYAILGVEGADGFTTLASANPVIDGDDVRYPTSQELIDKIGTPFSRGSRALPVLEAQSAWYTMATFAGEIEAQQLPYLGSGFASTGLPTINSTSVIASLLHYVGVDLGSYLPYGMRMSPGRTTLIGTTQNDEMQIEGAFTTLVGGKGDDTFRGTDSSQTESFYGGTGSDTFVWSQGYNIYHGGQPYLDYDGDGVDTLIYDGVGEAFIRKNYNAIPHIFPDYYVNYSTGFDWLFSVERFQWDNSTDHIHLEDGLQIIEDGLIIELKGEQVGGASDTKGDVFDLSGSSDGLLINASTSDAVFISDVSSPSSLEGLWLDDAEWIIGSDAQDRIYLASSMRGAEGGGGDDIIDARLIDGSGGTGPNGYEAEIDGGGGDDTIVAGRSITYATGGSGADSFYLSTMTGRADAVGTVELIIADADGGDRLYAPYNFFNESEGGFEGSEMLPVLGALGTYSDMQDNGWALYFDVLTEADYFYGDDRTDGVIDFSGAIEFTLESDDLMIRFYQGEGVTITEEIDDVGTTITYTENSIDNSTETIVRVLDFQEGDLGLVFHDLGDPTQVDLGDGTFGTSYPNHDSAVYELTNNGSLFDGPPDRPTPPASNPNEGGGQSGQPEILVGSADDDIIIATSETSDIDSGAGDDTVTGGSGDDTLNGGSGDDTLAGGLGDDTYYVDSASDTVTELADGGTDTVFASVDYVLPIHVENLTLTGAALAGTGNGAANTLIGNDGANTLQGGDGDDTLYGGTGDDTLSGGDGSDGYVYQLGDGDDVISDTGVNSAADDLLFVGINAVDELTFTRRSDLPDDLVIQISAGGRILVEDFFTSTDAGIDGITFQDGATLDRTAIETLALAGDVETNDPPQAVDDFGLFARGAQFVIPNAALIANDRDFDGDGFSITSVQNAVGGTVSLLSGGDVQIDVAAGFEGEVTFRYTITDTHGATDDAEVGIAVMPDNLAPIALDDAGFEVADIDTLVFDAATLIENDFDLDGDDISVSAVSNAVGGAVTLAPDGTVTFDPTVGYDGVGGFDYTISDGQGETATASVSLDVHQVNVISGTSGGDTIVGTSGWDHIDGLNGNDVISGGSGNDELYGGSGSDDLDGGSGADYLDGGSGNDLLIGGGNFDVLIGGNNSDDLYGDAGNDTLDGGSGNDFLDGGTGTDMLFGGKGSDTINGGEGSDWAYGGDGADVIDGQDGKDHLFGEASGDTINGGAGDDEQWGGGGYDVLSGGDDNDDLWGEAGNDILNGDAGNDVLDGGSGSDTLSGGAGDDILAGGDGSDDLDGGFGDDVLTGGSGGDTFIFKPGYGNDVIADFGQGGADLIDVADFGYADFASLMGDAADVGNDVVVTFDATTSLTLQDVQVAGLSDSDFRLA